MTVPICVLTESIIGYAIPISSNTNEDCCKYI